MKPEKVIQLVEDAIEKQIIPALFTPAQLAEMQKPFHEKWDHYNFATLMTGDKAYAAIGFAAPQLAINDPRITQAQIDAAPKTLTVEIDGVKHTVPFRVYKNYHETVPEWQATKDFQARSREAIATLEQDLKSEFNLSSGKDYSIGYGIGAQGNKKAASFMVQMYNAKSRKLGPEVKKYMEDKLKALTPERPSNVIITGPVVAF